MAVPSLGRLLEGHLRLKNGQWMIETPEGTYENLESILTDHQDEEVRFTIVKLQDLDKLAKMLEETGYEMGD